MKIACYIACYIVRHPTLYTSRCIHSYPVNYDWTHKANISLTRDDVKNPMQAFSLLYPKQGGVVELIQL